MNMPNSLFSKMQMQVSGGRKAIPINATKAMYIYQIDNVKLNFKVNSKWMMELNVKCTPSAFRKTHRRKFLIFTA